MPNCCLLFLAAIGARRMIWECEMSHILFITKWADQELLPIPRSTVIAACCLTVNRAGKWQWLDVVAPATHNPSWATQRPISSTHFSPRWAYAYTVRVAHFYGNYPEKKCAHKWVERITFHNNSRLGCRHIIPQSPRKVRNWAKETKWFVPNISAIKRNAVMRHVASGFWLASTRVGLVW